MEKIASFMINHDTLVPGIYISRVDGDVCTYDLRFCIPNRPPFIDQPAMHTLEHIYATVMRNSKYADSVIYFGPMGCRTGFYLLTRSLPHRDVIELIIETTKAAANWSCDIPGASAVECGNWREHDFELAKKWASGYLRTISGWTLDMLSYPD